MQHAQRRPRKGSDEQHAQPDPHPRRVHGPPELPGDAARHRPADLRPVQVSSTRPDRSAMTTCAISSLRVAPPPGPAGRRTRPATCRDHGVSARVGRAVLVARRPDLGLRRGDPRRLDRREPVAGRRARRRGPAARAQVADSAARPQPACGRGSEDTGRDEQRAASIATTASDRARGPALRLAALCARMAPRPALRGSTSRHGGGVNRRTVSRETPDATVSRSTTQRFQSPEPGNQPFHVKRCCLTVTATSSQCLGHGDAALGVPRTTGDSRLGVPWDTGDATP